MILLIRITSHPMPATSRFSCDDRNIGSLLPTSRLFVMRTTAGDPKMSQSLAIYALVSNTPKATIRLSPIDLPIADLIARGSLR